MKTRLRKRFLFKNLEIMRLGNLRILQVLANVLKVLRMAENVLAFHPNMVYREIGCF
jgi:hypothetical protein